MKIKLIWSIFLVILIITSSYGGTTIINQKNDFDELETLSRNTVTFYSIPSDGHIQKSGGDYEQIWESENGDVWDTIHIRIGQLDYITFFIFRGFFLFDTSSIPDNAIISQATLSLYGAIDHSGIDFDIVIQDGQPVYPHNPLQSGDYYKGHYSGDGGSFNTLYFSNSSYNDITLNAFGRSWINKQGVTKLCLRSNRDIQKIVSTIAETVWVYSGDSTNFKPKLTVTYNTDPDTPSKPSGTTNGNANTDYTYTTSTTDPDGDQVYYKFDWDDGTYSDWEGPYNSGETASATHSWECAGTYYVKVKAKDEHDKESGWSDSLIVSIANNQPNPPSTPNGPTTGYNGISYTYSTSATDPEEHQVKIYFDWDDGSGTWTNYVNSGQSVSKSHTWTSPGTYHVKAKAKDKCGLEGGWSEDLIVNLQNQEPYVPNNPNPSNGETGVETNTILTWDGGDPNGDTVYYDVYFGTDEYNLDCVSSGQTSTSYDPSGELENLTTYYWKIIAEDQFGDQALGPIWSFTTREYHSPVLSNYDGWQTGHIPESGNQQTDFTFCIHYEDADQDSPVEKKLLFDNGKEFTMEVFNGQAYNGDYKVVLKGSQIGGGTHTYWFWFKDVHDGVRYPPVGEEWSVTINHAPNAPILSGPSSGVPGNEYIFSAVTDDPEGDDIKYKFDWGDGTDTGWIPADTWKASGSSIDAKHSWSKGTYTIRAKAMDREGDESPWSNEITLKVQKGRVRNNEFFRVLIQNLFQKSSLLEIMLNLFSFYS